MGTKRNAVKFFCFILSFMIIHFFKSYSYSKHVGPHQQQSVRPPGFLDPKSTFELHP